VEFVVCPCPTVPGELVGGGGGAIDGAVGLVGPVVGVFCATAYSKLKENNNTAHAIFISVLLNCAPRTEEDATRASVPPLGRTVVEQLSPTYRCEAYNRVYDQSYRSR